MLNDWTLECAKESLGIKNQIEEWKDDMDFKLVEAMEQLEELHKKEIERQGEDQARKNIAHEGKDIKGEENQEM